jgi:hypothetical protein
MIHRARTIGTIVLVLLALLALPSAVRAQALTLVPDTPSVAAGQRITFTGAGFVQGEIVATWATAPDQAVIGGETALAKRAEGQIKVSFRVPKDAIGGRWALTAFGRTSMTPVIANFDVAGRTADTSTPQAAVAPASGPPGTKFAFAAFGFKNKEKLSYWFTGPDGLIHAAFPKKATSNKSGRVDITWVAPADAPRGIWVITIQGIQSNVARGVPFEIR